MTSSEQLQLWLDGESVHNKERGECTPDFSCCRPELLAPQDVRQAFIDADEDRRELFLLGFLGAALAHKDVYIAGTSTGGTA